MQHERSHLYVMGTFTGEAMGLARLCQGGGIAPDGAAEKGV